MPEDANSLYLSAVAELQRILESIHATSEQKNVAEKALQDLTVLHGAYPIGRIEGRTAVLSGLIIELTAVMEAIQVNPVGGALDSLNQILSTARELYQAEKIHLPRA